MVLKPRRVFVFDPWQSCTGSTGSSALLEGCFQLRRWTQFLFFLALVTVQEEVRDPMTLFGREGHDPTAVDKVSCLAIKCVQLCGWY